MFLRMLKVHNNIHIKKLDLSYKSRMSIYALISRHKMSRKYIVLQTYECRIVG